MQKQFTFHYGYILMSLETHRMICVTGFTFHYGYILMNGQNERRVDIVEFTFHYGYILIHSVRFKWHGTVIYIPLWLYSN